MAGLDWLDHVSVAIGASPVKLDRSMLGLGRCAPATDREVFLLLMRTVGVAKEEGMVNRILRVMSCEGTDLVLRILLENA